MRYTRCRATKLIYIYQPDICLLRRARRIWIYELADIVLRWRPLSEAVTNIIPVSLRTQSIPHAIFYFNDPLWQRRSNSKEHK